MPVKLAYRLVKVGSEVYGGHEVDRVIWLTAWDKYTKIKLKDGRIITTTDSVTLIEAPPEEQGPGGAW